jgi:hypothetical protein
MKRYAGAISTILFFIPCPSQAQPADLSDFTVVAYKLRAEQETQYSYTDGVLSDFWNTWDTVDLDFIAEIPSTNGYTPDNRGWDGELDAQLAVRCAYSDRGLYVMLKVMDDNFVDIVVTGDGDSAFDQGAAEWMNDGVDMYLDIYSSSEQIAQNRFFLNFDQLTTTTKQYQYRFGSAMPGNIVRINYFNPAWDGTADVNKAILYNHVSVEEAHQNYGILFEVVPLENGIKAQEWFIPWNQAGAGMNPPAQGQLTAFIVGYNDADQSSEKSPDLLRWKNRGDAYGNNQNWGDIQFGGYIDEQAAEAVRPGHPILPPAQMKILRNAHAKDELYTTDGRRIAIGKPITAVGCSVMVRRIASAGMTRSSSIAVLR